MCVYICVCIYIYIYIYIYIRKSEEGGYLGVTKRKRGRDGWTKETQRWIFAPN